MLLTLLALSAHAQSINPQLTVDLSLLVGSDPEHRFGVQLGAGYLLAIGDRVETTGFLGSLWPVAGPRAAVGWRGGTSVVGEVSAVAGIGSLETHDKGYLPYWTLLARGGVGFDKELGLLVGGELSKSFSTRFAAPTGAEGGVGTDELALRLEMHQQTQSGAEQVFGAGLQIPALGVSDLLAQ